jgi:hypothetical protein
MNPNRWETPNPTIKSAPHASNSNGCRNNLIHHRRASARVAVCRAGDRETFSVAAEAALFGAVTSSAAGGMDFSESLMATSQAFLRSISLDVHIERVSPNVSDDERDTMDGSLNNANARDKRAAAACEQHQISQRQRTACR